MASLFPGYKQVESFGEDDEYECEDGEVVEEVEYVTLDLGTVEPTLVPSSSSYRLIGLDTPTPFLQLSGTMLKGQHVSLLGTELLFTESNEEHHERGKKPLVHVANTERRIRFREVELRPKQAGDAPPDASTMTTTTAKSSGVAKKVESQMNHVMSGSAAPSRRGRGGRKRGSSSRARKTRSDDVPPQPTEKQDEDAEPDVGSASMVMDTSEG